MMYWNTEKYLKAWNFASVAHQNQFLPNSRVPYLNHLGSVAMESLATIALSGNVEDPNLLVECALLHDILENTTVQYNDLKAEFGAEVADGVLALTKNKKLGSKQEQMIDSLKRVVQQPKEVWMVKMCDRITNLQTPPNNWSQSKVTRYRQESLLIWEELMEANSYLARRLHYKITQYPQK